MAKLMQIASDDDYRAMIIFKSLLLMGIDMIPSEMLDRKDRNIPNPHTSDEAISCH